MAKIKIGIIEDEVIIADDLHDLLEEMGYDCLPPGNNYGEAVSLITDEQPDLMLLDINLSSKKDGIDIGKYIRANHNIPFIFLTANSDPATIARAKETMPNAYLVKPFQKADLYAAIEIALYNFNMSNARQDNKPVKKLLPDSLFIKEGDYFHKVNFNDIIYLSSEHVYVMVHTLNKKFLVRASMQDYLENFDATKFVRVHRSHAINIDRVDKINTSSILVGGYEIPISKNYRDELLRLLKIS